MNQNVARRPRFKRVPDFPNMCLTARDREILSAVCRYRFITTGQILSLVPGSRQNIMRRLQRLYHGGFLDRPHAQLPLRFAGEISELVYASTRKSLLHDQKNGEVTVSGKEWKRISSLFLAHTLAVSDALISIEAGCRTLGLRFVNEQEILNSTPDRIKRLLWQTTIKNGKASERVGMIPDALFAIDRQNAVGTRRLFYFVEVDRGTMPLYRKSLRLSSIYRKALVYSQSRRTRVLNKRYGIPGFQVLFVTDSDERLKRMENVCHEVSKESDASTFLFATSEKLRQTDALAKLGMV